MHSGDVVRIVHRNPKWAVLMNQGFRGEMAGVVGLEPTVHGTKNRCLTCLATPQLGAKTSALPAKRQESTYRRLSVENQSLRLAPPAVIRRCDAGRLAWPIALLFAVSDWLDAL